MTPIKTIGIDCRFAATTSGLGRYTRELVTHLLRRTDPVKYILFVRSEQEEWIASLPSTSLRSDSGQANYTLHTANFAHYSLAEQLLFPKILRAAKIDLVFSPHFNVPYFCPVPLVVTIHDLILHRFPNDSSVFKQWAYRLLMRRVVSKASHIVAVSNFTAHEIRSVYPDVPSSRITVVSEGVSDHYTKKSPEECRRVLEKYGINVPFFLYVGNAKQHKNVSILVESFTEMKNLNKKLVLIMAGPEAQKITITPGIMVIPHVSEQDLPTFYSSALAFVTASLYEGFCLPIAEAQACGCPIIASRRGAIPEISPPPAVLVEPTVEALRAALESPPPPDPHPVKREWSDTAKIVSHLLQQHL